jgi:hypothetical protein
VLYLELVALIMSEGGEQEVGGLGRAREREEAAEGDTRDLEEEGGETGMEESHKELARDMFEKITEYLNGELAGMCGYSLTLVGCECTVVRVIC